MTDDDDAPNGRESESRSSSRWITAVVAAGALFVFGALALYAYPGIVPRGSGEGIPVITAGPDPVRVRPEDRGGRKVRFQEMEIFGTQQNAPAPPETRERLRPPPERPMVIVPRTTPDEAQAGYSGGPAGDGGPGDGGTVMAAVEPSDGEDQPGQSAGDAGLAATDGVPLPRLRPDGLVSAQVTADAQAPGSAGQAVPSPRLRPSDLAPAAAPPRRPASRTPVTRSAAASGVRVQVGAHASETDARSAWSDLQGRHPAELGSLALTIQRTTGGSGPAFHRVLGGPVSMARARQICAILTARGQACIVVRP